MRSRDSQSAKNAPSAVRAVSAMRAVSAVAWRGRVRAATAVAWRGRMCAGVGLAVLAALVSACGSEQRASGQGCDALAGDLVVSEVMVNPDGRDDGREWIELYNTADVPLTIDRLVVVFESDASTQRHVIHGVGSVEAKTYFVLGGDAALLPFLDYGYGGDLSLNNTAGRISLRCKDELVDSIAYGPGQALPTPAEGGSLSLDGGIAPDAMANDESAWWCAADAQSYYDGGANRGTPGARNGVCGIRLCQPPVAGDVRETRPPGAGGLQFTEIFANPEGPDDAGREWVELFVAAPTPIDLNGIEFVNTNDSGNSHRWQIQGSACMAVDPAATIIIGFAASADQIDPVLQSQVDVVVVGDELYNSAGTLAIEHAGVVIDSVAVAAPVEAKPSVVARGVCHEASGGARATRGSGVGALIVSEVFADPTGSDRNREWLELFVASPSPVDLNGLEIVNRVGEDAVRSWRIDTRACIEAVPGDFMVIGFAASGDDLDASIPADAVVHGAGLFNDAGSIEVWQGNVLVDIAATPAPVSGVASSLDRAAVTDAAKNDAASSFCSAKTKGAFGDGEEKGTPGASNDLCAASCFDHGVERPSVAPTAGSLVLTEIFADPSGPDADRDWFEFYVAAGGPIDLNGLRVVNTSVASGIDRIWQLDAAECLTVQPGQYAVVAGQGAAADGVQASALLVGGTSTLLINAEALLSIWHGIEGIDSVPYGTPISGVATALDPTALDATANDDVAHWCAAATSAAGFTGRGSPGQPNASCD